MTETNAVGCIIGQDDYQLRPGSVERPTSPLVEIKIVDAIGDELPQGETGEIWIRSPAVPAGYLNLPEATAEAFTDGWCHTGDVGYFDSEGFLYIVDRLKDIIIRGGENISCLEVEEGLYMHPDVAEVAVFGLPDERLGEVVGAVITTASGKALDTEQVRAFLAERLAAFKIPVYVWSHEGQLPRIASGKIDKKLLRRYRKHYSYIARNSNVLNLTFRRYFTWVTVNYRAIYSVKVGFYVLIILFNFNSDI